MERLDKVLAATGRWSRREVKLLVKQGQVRVNGAAASSAEEKLDPEAVPVVLPAAAYDWLSPLLNYLPMALLAGYLCELKHESYGRGGRDDWAVTATTKLLTDSRIEIL